VRHREAHGKKKQLTVPAANGVEGPLPCATTKNARQRSYLCRAPALETHGKGTVPAVGNSAFAVRLHLNTRQTFSKKIKKTKAPAWQAQAGMLAH
jgi:uncharacterized protein YfaQ (DUF2300 family)